MVGLARCCALLLLPTLGYTFDSFASAQLALRANLRLVYLQLSRACDSRPSPKVSILAPAPALDCLSLGICAIARVFFARQLD